MKIWINILIKKKKEKERKKERQKRNTKRCTAQQRVNLTRKKEIFFKSFAEQTDIFTVLNFPT